MVSCNTKNSNILSSKSINERAERVAILKKEIKPFSEFTDAEFFLINANGFSNGRESVPGATSLNYMFALKVDSNDIVNWIKGMREFPNSKITFPWLNELPSLRKNTWQIHSTPIIYVDLAQKITLAVYKKEGIIFKQITSN